jgi:hypothetical protein
VTAKSVARDARPHPDSQIHHVTIGSANAVIKDATKRDKLKKDLWVLCAEMEAAGLMDESPCLVIQLFSGHAPSLRNSIHLRNPTSDTCQDSRCRNHNDDAFSSASLSQISSRISYTLSPTRAASWGVWRFYAGTSVAAWCLNLKLVEHAESTKLQSGVVWLRERTEKHVS